MKKITTTLLASSLALISAANAAVTIGSVGNGSGYDITGAQTFGFYDSSVAKTFDVNGDDLYGTDGYYVFGGTGTNNGAEYNTAGVFEASTPTFVDSITADTAVTLVRKNDSQLGFSNPSLGDGGGDFANGGYLMNNGTAGTTGLPMLSFSVTNSNEMSFRLGILAGNIAGTQFQASGFSLLFDDGVTTPVTASVGTLGTITSDMGMVFFDVDLDAGTTGTFTILADENTSNPILNGVTFDVAAVPEPSSSVMLLGGLGGLLLRRRRA
ncbi:PEP-CTERM sorting domain-containing protein [Rubritalea sp.]|uniref:PEP-CTERM sorting domain-containing protein n=1 Tax=Rubritalea sp. TaxID=2109375 RepID=UPI003EF5C7D7